METHNTVKENSSVFTAIQIHYMM